MSDFDPSVGFVLKFHIKKALISALSHHQYISAGLFGGLVRVLTSKGQISFRRFIAGLLGAAFASLVIYGAIEEKEISDGLKVSLCAMSGYSWFVVLKVFQRVLDKTLNKIAEEKNSE